jgi:hypothetical protein
MVRGFPPDIGDSKIIKLRKGSQLDFLGAMYHDAISSSKTYAHIGLDKKRKKIFLSPWGED